MDIKSDIQTLPPPPGIIGSLRAGFDAIAAHISAIILPLVLDLFLWLGPQLKVDHLYEQFYTYLMKSASDSGMTSTQIAQIQSSYPTSLAQIQKIDLFSILRTLPIGVPSLMSGENLTASPLGTPMIYQVDSYGRLFGLLFLFTICGWIFGGLYFRWVAFLVSPKTSAPASRAILQTLLYSFLWFLLAWIIGTPVTLVLYLLFAIHPLLGEGALLLLGFLSMWLIVPVFFSSFGIYLGKQNAFTSLFSSLQLTRFALPTSSLFVLTMFMIGIGLNLLWVIPTNDSWLTLVGILGHAFIMTSLLASSFVYYRDTTAWLQSVFEKLRAATPTQQA